VFSLPIFFAYFTSYIEVTLNRDSTVLDEIIGAMSEVRAYVAQAILLLYESNGPDPEPTRVKGIDKPETRRPTVA
jgi:hypothetical protein